MEGFQKAIRSGVSKQASGSGSDSGWGSHPSEPASLTLLSRSPSPRRAVSVLTCSKLCGVCFVAGLILGFTLKRRLRRLAARLLKRINDD